MYSFLINMTILYITISVFLWQKTTTLLLRNIYEGFFFPKTSYQIKRLFNLIQQKRICCYMIRTFSQRLNFYKKKKQYCVFTFSQAGSVFAYRKFSLKPLCCFSLRKTIIQLQKSCLTWTLTFLRNKRIILSLTSYTSKELN